MMDWTDLACRRFHRVLSRRTVLYTEMVTSAALVRGGATHLLAHDPGAGPVILQLGGSDPAELARAAAMGADAGFDGIDLNCGCPSDRVQSGTFGAVLMRDPARVAACAAAMIAAQPRPVSVKCRIGVDDQDPAAALPAFLAAVRDAGVRRVTIHARKAWLKGLSPKQNREVPPLDHDLAHAMRDLFPDLTLTINGGIASLAGVRAHLARGMHGVMVGRAAYHDPWAVLGRADSTLHGAPDPCADPHDAALAMRPVIEAHLAEGGRLHQVTRHMLGLFTGRPGARAWRRILSEGATRDGVDYALVEAALAAVPRDLAA
ncbi:MAG: tRNA dihydrouridine(20/20a) synthase DusA [Paracoccaceae bacterium]